MSSHPYLQRHEPSGMVFVLLILRLVALAAFATVVAMMIADARPAAHPAPSSTSYIVGPDGDNVRVLP